MSIDLGKFPTLQAALTEIGDSGQTLYVPPGRTVVQGENYASGNLKIEGDTSSGNQLVFEDGASLIYRGKGASGDLPDTAASGQYNTTELVFENCGICVTGKTGKVIDAQWSNSGNSGTLAPTFTTRGLSIYAAPATGTEPGSWEHAIYLAGASNVSIERSRIMGGRDGKQSCSYGVFVDGSQQTAVEFFATRLHTSYCRIGYYFAGHVEGMNLLTTTTLECDYSVIADSSSNPGAWPMLYIADSHMSARHVGVLTTGIVQIDISHNLIYSLASPNAVGILLNSADIGGMQLNSRITNNDFGNLGGSGNYGIFVNHTHSGVESLNIDDNTFDRFTTPIYQNTGVIGVRVGSGNQYLDCGPKKG